MRRLRHTWPVWAAVTLGVVDAGFRPRVQPSSAPQVPSQAVSAAAAGRFFGAYCGGCHRAGASSVDLDGAVDRRSLRLHRAKWEHVASVLHAGDMPPRRWPQPAPEERRAVVAWLEEELAAVDFEASGLFVRRLRGSEYRNIIRDLFDVDFQPEDGFPPDDPGWDAVGSVPLLEPALREAYEHAADSILEMLPIAEFAARADVDDATVLLADLTRRAYRRALDPLEVAELRAIVERRLLVGWGLHGGIRFALKEVLTSPQFLYVIEYQRQPGEQRPGPQQAFELASRLSFFLWGSAPDRELLDLAERGELSNVLAAQVRRLLADRRAAAFAENLADAWLGLGRLNEVPHVAAPLRDAMRQETVRFVGSIVAEDRGVFDFIDADHTFVNGALAAHYGLPDVDGDEMRRISLSGQGRSGLLTQASILTLTSPTPVSSPTRRGKWVMVHLLGTPPPLPPAGALQALDRTRNNFGAVSTRDLLAQHLQHTACTHCHVRMDAIGLALEQFDAQGVARPEAQPQAENPTVLPDGAVLHGVDSLRRYLRDQRPAYVAALVGVLLGQALDRKLTDDDAAAVQQVVDACSAEPRCSELITRVVESELFQTAAGAR